MAMFSDCEILECLRRSIELLNQEDILSWIEQMNVDVKAKLKMFDYAVNGRYRELYQYAKEVLNCVD